MSTNTLHTTSAEPIGHLQLRIMRHIWATGPTTVQAAHAALNSKSEKQLAYTTILTVLRNLAKRGLVSQEKVKGSRSHVFTARVDRKEYTSGQLRAMVDGLFDGDKESMISAIHEAML